MVPSGFSKIPAHWLLETFSKYIPVAHSDPSNLHQFTAQVASQFALIPKSAECRRGAGNAVEQQAEGSKGQRHKAQAHEGRDQHCQGHALIREKKQEGQTGSQACPPHIIS